MSPAIITSLSLSMAGWLLEFLVWLLIWAPLVALLEYAAHRWIMHRVNRLLDPQLSQLQAHHRHHQGRNDDEFVDMPLKNCLLLTSPFIALVAGWGLLGGPLASIVIAIAALLSWSFCYTYLWTRMHRAIHDNETNWFRRSGPVFRFFRNHHLKHHVHANVNYGTVFPWTDYVFFTWHRPRVNRLARAMRRRRAKSHAHSGE